MCGIFGFRTSWARARGLDPTATAAAMLARLAWRGRDGSEQRQHGDWVLGCARLAISGARRRQPVILRGGRWAGVCNGAITSARQDWQRLRPRLARREPLPNDAWLPVVACAAGRLHELEAMHGHYALAVVDATTDEVVLRQDPMGEKPLFVVRDAEGVVAFASTPAALRPLGVDVVVDGAFVARFFRFGNGGAPTLAAGPGATAAAWPVGGHPPATPAAGSQPVRTPAARAPAAGRSPAPSAQHGGGWQQELAAAVRRCADVDQPLGLMLSGGIDSSVLAAELAALTASAAGGPPPSCPAYQFRAQGAADEERQVAAAVAGHCGLVFRPVDGGPEVLAPLAQLTAWAGLPLGDPSVLAAYAVARAAAGDGVRVLLSGEGADELLLGYDRQRAVAHLPTRGMPWLSRLPQSRWSMRRPARLLRALTARDPYAALLAVAPPAMAGRVLAPTLPPARLPSASATSGQGGPQAKGGAANGIAGPVDVPAGGGVPMGRSAARLLRAQAVDLDFYLRWDLLPKLDVATLAAGVEGRCPFLDPTFRGAVAGLPREALLGKQPLRRQYADRLPRLVFEQRKHGFALPLDDWFRGELVWLDLLREARTRQRPHLRPGGVERAIDRHRSGAVDLGHALYLLVAFELYLRAHEEDPPCG